MGRTLEALKRADARPSRPAETAPKPHLAAPAAEPPPQAEPEPDVAVSFIEVGGPRTVLEASPDVLASVPKQHAKSSPPIQGPHFRPIEKPAVEPTFMTVAFRPQPGQPTAPISLHRLAAELVAFHQPSHAVSEQYRVLAGKLATQLPAARSQVLLFTAVNSDVGATTVVLNTAITYARQGSLRVAVVDANLRHPAVADRMGLPESPGLCEFHSGALPLHKALQETGQPNCLALTVGSARREAMSRSISDLVLPALRQLREYFDLVLVDAGPWDGRPEIVALSSACDAVYLVLPTQDAETTLATGSIDQILRAGARLLGCVLTKR
jgi:Mrp family chromosome partitioning ATPase